MIDYLKSTVQDWHKLSECLVLWKIYIYIIIKQIISKLLLVVQAHDDIIVFYVKCQSFYKIFINEKKQFYISHLLQT